MPAADNTLTMAALIRANWHKSTPYLHAVILQHHPDTTVPEIVAELRRQAAENLAEADRLAIAGPAEGSA